VTELQTHPDASIPAANPAGDDAPAPALPTHPARERADRIARWTVVALAVLLTACLARVVQLQVAPGKNLSPFISGRVSTHTIPGVRGDLQDRRGRILHATRFGYRVFVDPARFPQQVDKPMIDLADALGIPVADVAQRLIPKIAQNQRHLTAKNDKDPWTEPDAPLARYVSIGGVLDDWRVDAVRGLRIPGVHLETRSVREAADDGLTASIVGRVGVDHNGLLGAENRMDRELKPAAGELRYVQDARARPLWVEPGAYKPPVRGEDVRLSLDLDIQRMAEEELSSGVRAADAAGGRLIAMDPNTGEILAMVDLVRDLPGLVDYSWDYPIGQEPDGRKPRYRTIAKDPLRSVAPGMGRNRIVEDVYEPGSTFKSFMWAAASELGVARPGEIIDTEYGQWVTPYGRRVADVTKLARQSWTDVLVNSSNIGMAKVTSRMSFLQMHDAVRKFGFGSRTGLPLPGESPGLVTTMRNWSKYTQTSVAMGHEVAVTPIQMVRAFSVFARSGELAGTIPGVRLTAAAGEQLASTRRPLPTTLRVLPREVAELARSTMRGVTHKLDERMATRDPSADAPRYEAFGKSGTAEIPLGKAPAGKRRPKGSDGYFQDQYNSSFIAGAPLEDPRIVVLVVIDDPGPNRVATRTHYGASTAGPVARRFIERSLAYLGVPPSIAPAKVASAPAGD
jgi:cell division protein FtsI (penicillin-binding protein 3)